MPHIRGKDCDLASERLRRRIARQLDEAEEAVSRVEWGFVGTRAKAVCLLDQSLAISRELGMRPLVGRVLSKREIMGA